MIFKKDLKKIDEDFTLKQAKLNFTTEDYKNLKIEDKMLVMNIFERCSSSIVKLEITSNLNEEYLSLECCKVFEKGKYKLVLTYKDLEKLTNYLLEQDKTYDDMKKKTNEKQTKFEILEKLIQKKFNLNEINELINLIEKM